MVAPKKSDPAIVADDLLELIHKHGMPALQAAFGDLRPTQRTVLVTQVPYVSEKHGSMVRMHVYGPTTTGAAQRFKKRMNAQAVKDGYDIKIGVHVLLNADDEVIPPVEEW